MDEALAVGDAAFQQKCVERMTGWCAEGRTLLFVSHNLFVVEALCSRGSLLLDGKVAAVGPISGVLSRYISIVDEGFQARRRIDQPIAGAGIDLVSSALHDGNGTERYVYSVVRASMSASCYELTMTSRTATSRSGISDGRQGPVALCSMLEGERGVDLQIG